MNPMVLALLFSTTNSERAILLDDPMFGLTRSFRTLRDDPDGEDDKTAMSRSDFLVD